MAPRKKTRTVVWVKKLQQSLAEKITSLLPDCVSEKKAMKGNRLSVPDWSLLPEELLHIISEKLEDCFDVIHARSVCTLWRSTFPFPDCLLRTRYSLPSLCSSYPYKSKPLFTVQKIPLFLQTSPVSAASSACAYILGGIRPDESRDHIKHPSRIQCSMKVKMPESDPTIINIRDRLILPLGHQYRMIWDQGASSPYNRCLAFLLLNKEARVGEEFVVLLNYNGTLMSLRSSEMRWKVCLTVSEDASCQDLVAFRGKFCAVFINGDSFVFDPYSLVKTPLTMPLPPLRSGKFLVRSGDNELFLVEIFNPDPQSESIYFDSFVCRVSRLDEEAGKWVVVTELGDLVFFIGHFGNVCCSAKKLPVGCGVSGNSIIFTNAPRNVTYTYKYGVHTHTGTEEDDLNCWRLSRENRVTILSTSSVVALRIDRLKLKP